LVPAIEERPWAEVVFHVLAHVPGGAAASLWEPRYVRWAEARLGPASLRALGDDVRALAALLPDHDALATAQLLAWVFRDPARAERVFDRGLGELEAGHVDDAALLARIRAAAPAVLQGADLLFCAAALEAPSVARLPPLHVDQAALSSAVLRLAPLAPALSTVTLGVVRALGWRGRVLRGEICVGAPETLDEGPTLEHVSWQAAHEAVVAEVSRAGAAGHADTEHVAIVLLAERARGAGLGEPHARWLSSLRAPPSERASLGADAALLLAAVERSGT
jgi:hypothetical protein